MGAFLWGHGGGNPNMTLAIDDIWWSHNSVFSHFRDGRSLFETVVDLLIGNVNPSDLPALEVIRIGSRTYSLSNRRLFALKTYQKVLRRVLHDDTLEVQASVVLKEPLDQLVSRASWALSTDTVGTAVSL